MKFLNTIVKIQANEGRREIFKENIRRFLANKPFIYVCDKIAGF